MLRTLSLGLMLVVMLVVIAGCSSSRHSQRDPRPPFGPPPPAPVMQGGLPGQPFPAAPGAPGAPPQFPAAPAGGFPTAPGSPAPNFPSAPPGPSPQFPTVPPGGNAAPAFPTAPPGPTSQLESNWQPAEARVPANSRVLLAPPEPLADNLAKDTAKQSPPPQVDAAAAAKLPSAALPVAIPQFAPIKPQVATGRRPLDDGFAWLETNKYRGVLYLRLPGENDDADRKLAESHKLNYQSIEVSPNLLTKDTVDEFFKLVRDPMNQPLFVYDRDGALAGGLWYLWFRVAEQDPEDVARIRARAAGLREDRDGASREMWQTVQKYLNDLPR
jgi:protein tyrosine phosphatase (PTP) superfamily phosphohydrolase (DUF442 family)